MLLLAAAAALPLRRRLDCHAAVRPRASRRGALLAAWLLLFAFAQGALAFHDAEHWQPKAHAHVCSLCSHHAGQPQAPGAASAPALSPGPLACLRPAAADSIRCAPRLAYRSRGPPSPSA